MNTITTFLQADWAERAGWALLHSLWQIAAVAAVYAIAALLLRNRSADSRYVLGCVAIFAMLGLPMGTYVLLSDDVPLEIAQPSNTPAVAPSPTESPPPPSDLTEPAIAPADPLPPVAHSDPVPVKAASAEPATTDLFSGLRRYLPWATAGWLMGVMLLSLRPLWGWFHVRRLRCRGLSPLSDTLRHAGQRVKRRLGVNRAVGFVQSALVEVPTVIGCLRPMVLLPASAITGLSTAEIESILAHELAHVKRLDWLANLAQTVIEALLFYHPGMWWVSNQLRKERENCCDDMAVAVGGNRAVYVQALARLEEQRSATSALALAATGGALLTRARRLLGKPSNECGYRHATAWLAGLITIGFVVAALAMNQAAEPLPKPGLNDDGLKRGPDAPQPKFAIYRVTGYRKPGDRPGTTSTTHLRDSGKPEFFDAMRPEKYPLEDLVLDGTPLITETEIAAYEWRRHIITLKPGVRERLGEAVKPPAHGVPFVVQADGKPIYLGAFWTSVSPPAMRSGVMVPVRMHQISAKMPTIGLGPESGPDRLPANAIRIDNLQTLEPQDLPTDPRQDKRVYRALGKTGKLLDLRSHEPPWGDAVEGVQSRLQRGVFRNGEQWMTFDLRNDSSNLSVQLGPGGTPTDILVDNVPYFTGDPAGPGPVCKPGQAVSGAQFKLDKNWSTSEELDKNGMIRILGGQRSLELKPGKHTVQVTVRAVGKEKDNGGRKEVDVTSNPVEVTIERALPGPGLSIDKAIEEEAPFAAVCEAVGKFDPTLIPIAPGGAAHVLQKFKVVDVLFGKAEPVDRIVLGYRLTGRPIASHERVIWIGHTRHMSLHGSLYGLKALPDTPQNRQAVKAAAPQASTAWGEAVEGVQSRLQRGEFRNGVQWLSFDLRNDSSDLSVQLGLGGMPMEILVDNVAHAFTGQIQGQCPVCKPGQSVTSGEFKLDKNWTPTKSVSGPETLELKPGKHTVQAIVYAAAKDAEHTGRKVRVLSNPVEVTIERALPGSKLSIDKAIEEEAPFAAVCEAVDRFVPTTTLVAPGGATWVLQEFKVVEVLFGKAGPVDRIQIGYRLTGRPIAFHERVIWIGHTRHMSTHGSLFGLKALPDTPENRQAVKAAVSQASTAWGQVVDGVACAVRPVTASFAPGDDIVVDVMYRNMSDEPVTVCVCPDPLYTWIHLSVKTAEGKRVMSGQHGTGTRPPLKLADFVTLGPKQTASFRQVITSSQHPEQWPRPGRYFLHAEINKINRIDEHLLGYDEFCRKHGLTPWVAGIESGVAAVLIATEDPPAADSEAARGKVIEYGNA